MEKTRNWKDKNQQILRIKKKTKPQKPLGKIAHLILKLTLSSHHPNALYIKTQQEGKHNEKIFPKLYVFQHVIGYLRCRGVSTEFFIFFIAFFLHQSLDGKRDAALFQFTVWKHSKIFSWWFFYIKNCFKKIY